jgi:limonene-1,2-epoxide hydrolase
MNAAEASALVSSFLASWRNRDIDQILGFIATGAVYHNVPVSPIVGREEIRGIFQAFLDTFAVASLDVVRMAAAPDLVLAERVDRFVLNDGRKVELPVTGVFELQDGKIVRFSDYFDLACFERQSGMKL